MKILIITFTGGVNPGTIMQALGVQTACKQMYPDAEISFLNFPDFKRSKLGTKQGNDGIFDTIRRKACAAYRLVKYERVRKRYMHYTRAIDLFEYSKNDVDYLKTFDLAVIGSDTILEQAYDQSGNIGLNWMPVDIKKIYFAASVSPAQFNPDKRLRDLAEKAKFIGLRDNLSINFFQNKLQIDKSRLIKQPDPSYFLNINQYRLLAKLTRKLKGGGKYALYNFGAGFPQKKLLADKLRELGYIVVSTAYNPDADLCFDTVNPFEWAAVFPLMDIIVTERFHDSVFGLRNSKPVIAIDWEKNRFAEKGDSKTYRILEDYGLTALHFNLCLSSDLSPITEAIRRIDMLFDRKAIIEKNEEITQRAYELLNEIKATI